MAGLAARYWNELRPSSAGQVRLDLEVRREPDTTEHELRRTRRRINPKHQRLSRQRTS